MVTPTPPTEYVITIRVRTTRPPRDDPFPHLAKTADAMFKATPGGTLHILGATVEQVPSIVSTATPAKALAPPTAEPAKPARAPM